MMRIITIHILGPLRHLRRRKNATAAGRVRIPSTLQVVGTIVRIGQRPGLFYAPLIDAHDKDAHRLLLFHTIFETFEPVIKPAKLYASQHAHGLLTHRRSTLAILAVRIAPHEVAMRPRTDDQVLLLAHK